MRKVILDYPFAELHGAVERKGAINRQKKFRDSEGRIIREGRQELYDVVNPRDYNRHPQTPAEKAHHERFCEAAHSAQAILRAADDSTNPSPELLEELSVWQARFHAQLLTTKNSQPDPEASIDPATGKGKRYVQFPAFLRAIIYNHLKLHQQQH